MFTVVNAVMATVVLYGYYTKYDDVVHTVGLAELMTTLDSVDNRNACGFIQYCAATSQTNTKLNWNEIARRQGLLDAPDLWLGANYEWAEQYAH